MTRICKLFCFCAEITSGTSRSARTYPCTSCVFFAVVLVPRQRSHLLNYFTVHSSGFSRGKIAPGTSSFFSFIFSCFFFFYSTFRFAILSCFIPAETFHLGFRHVCLPRVPPSYPINERAPSLGSRLSLFSKVSYERVDWGHCTGAPRPLARASRADR